MVSFRVAAFRDGFVIAPLFDAGDAAHERHGRCRDFEPEFHESNGRNPNVPENECIVLTRNRVHHHALDTKAEGMEDSHSFGVSKPRLKP